ncbi:trimeric LpxA-like protein [Talaromyces proteolyticus]|uniref:Trimeric LpxA-like protein n=1 Tax=Talaromyces proteolyticus TaxID=1131652 RepID=A0AAD4PV21_9EURO|nr:trimeric LpxA-like protein [Talaromyces proteolyticus]KAH8696005.1 trimeric LpxA-like protein [Talaromyces proteolyticus]
MAQPTEKEKMLRGDLYCAFTPELIRERDKCEHACNRFNTAGEMTRRRMIELWRDIVQDTRPLPPPVEDLAADEALFANEPWVRGPFHADYGYNVRVGKGVFINFNCVIIDTCLVTIGARTLFGPNVHLYSGTHPLDPAVRNGFEGPETGKEVHIGEDCWLGGNVTVLPGVTIGRGATIGAGSVVTKVRPLSLLLMCCCSL